jgi:anti-sigma regulatory factor (Ser/Thr protein kinase)
MGKSLFDEEGSHGSKTVGVSPGQDVTYQVLALQPGTGAPRLARKALRAWLARDDLRQIDTEVLLVASELVTNAVLHARTALELSYAADEKNVEVGVRDHDARPLQPLAAPRTKLAAESNWPLLALGGRGLAIVAAMADEWGVTETQDGKQVWARWSAPTFRPAGVTRG